MYIKSNKKLHILCIVRHNYKRYEDTSQCVMKIRTITLCCTLSRDLFLEDGNGFVTLEKLLQTASMVLKKVTEAYGMEGFEVQTNRIVTNNFEEWLLPAVPTEAKEIEIEMDQCVMEIQRKLNILQKFLHRYEISFCSLGACKNSENLQYVPLILDQPFSFACSYGASCQSTRQDFILAAKACLEVAKRSGDNGNFGYCVASNCPEGTPFFPASSAPSTSSSSISKSGDAKGLNYSLSIGLEAGDLVFLGTRGSTSYNEITDTLRSVFYQAMLPVQNIIEKALDTFAKDNNLSNVLVKYLGLDTSIAPGLQLPESIGFGMEQCGLNYLHSAEKEESTVFGDYGTIPIIAAITGAIKSINSINGKGESIKEEDKKIITVGYNGLMMPVMEDIILAQRAQEKKFTIRDLMLYSTVCGVGIDTVPIPGDVNIGKLAGVYLEMNTIAYRLQKPLSCRVLPMNGLKAGDVTDTNSPFLTNTTVFEL